MSIFSWRIKKIDKLLIQEFIPPFIVAFLIAMFVLTMQFLWLYIDDLAGKGVGLLVLAEMIYYLAISLIPMALPVAVLLASVIVFGNLSEKYELASLKTAGISLMRVMRSTMVLSALIGVASFLCANYMIPYANLKMRTRLYDIKKQKPALNLESGVFNDDFHGTSIRIGVKHADNSHIEDVMIDDDLRNQRNEFNVIRAKKGRMLVTPEGGYFVMNLEDGYQYQKAEPTSVRSKYPFIRTTFKEWNRTFDLGEFELDRTDENLFKSHHAMLSVRQLGQSLDSIRIKMDQLHSDAKLELWRKMEYFHYKPQDDTLNLKRIAGDEGKLAGTSGFSDDSLPSNLASPGTFRNAQKIPSDPSSPLLLKKAREATIDLSNILVDQPHLDSLMHWESIIGVFALDKKGVFLDNAKNAVRSSKNYFYEYRQKWKSEKEKRQRHLFHLHSSKFSGAIVCFIFLFIGAPMGAIVRKGGFGYPLLVAIFFFMFYIITTKLFQKLMQSNTLDALIAAWLPCIILLILGLFLTVKAMNDSKVIELSIISGWYNQILGFFKKKDHVGLEG